MNIAVKVIGASQLQKLLQSKSKKIDTSLEKDILKCCLKVEADAKKKSPIDTGRLRASLTHEVRNMIGKVGTNVEYAPFVEFGTSRMGAKPYLYPALRDNFNFIKKKLGKSVVDTLKKKI